MGKKRSISVMAVLFLSVSFACLTGGCNSGDVYRGGLVWDNWTTVDAGGTGSLPTGVTSGDFVRCKACHGWDAKGAEGGYVRRTATATRPNPTPGVDLTAPDADLSLRAIYNTGGRAFPPVGDTALDNQMPAYDVPEGLTRQQALDVLKFLKAGPKIGDYATLDISVNPVAYTFNGADIANGETLYASRCQSCHSTVDSQTGGVGPALGSYFAGDGKFSEGFHKTVYGIPGSIMTRAAMGNLTGQETADILAYIQDNL